MKPPQDERWDAIVVGSGISGGWAAKELAERGLRALVLEAGRDIDPATDYVEHVQPWEVRFRGRGDRQALERDQYIQKLCYACDEWGSKFFVNDRENPYEFDADKPFHWIRGRHVGGRSIMWGRQVYRWSDLDFEANLKDGIAVDWPIRYADVAPWYDYVERFVGISGQAEQLPQLPDGRFLPPMQLRCVETHVRDKLREKWGRDRVLTIGRVAILTENHNGRAACHYCGPCERGCITHSYFTSIGSTLPAARRTGRMTLRPHSVVHSVIYDEGRDRATGVRVIDATTLQPLEFRARLIFLCASALESARILLNSKSPRFATGLGNSSGQLGRNVMDHVFGAGAGGTLPGMEDRTSYGRRPNGIYIPRFRNVKDRHPDFLRGYGFQGGSALNFALGAPGFGQAYKEAVKNGQWTMNLVGFGECLPYKDNRVTLNKNVTDVFGIPVLHFNIAWGENEKTMIRDMAVTAGEMLEASGAKNVRTFALEDRVPGYSIHEMGTARMGSDPKQSVLNQFQQSHDVKNLFVMDAAGFPSGGCQNPTLTIMAMAVRSTDHLMEELKKGNL